MKKYPVSAEDQMEDALLLLKRIGDAVQHPMVVIRNDNTIPYANPHFLAFTKDMGPGFLIQSADQVAQILPGQDLLDRVWQTGNPCTARVRLRRPTGTLSLECDCIPFVNMHQKVALVTIIYRNAGNTFSDTPGDPEFPEPGAAAFRESYLEFGETLDRFSRGFPEKTNPPHADDPLADIKRKYNEGIDRVQKMLCVKGLFG